MRLWPAAFLLALVFALPAWAEKPEIDSLRCPDNQSGQNLKDFDILQGEPADKDYLLASDDGWDLQGNRSEGQKFYLICHYGESGPDMQLEIPPNIDFCTPADNNVDCR